MRLVSTVRSATIGLLALLVAAYAAPGLSQQQSQLKPIGAARVPVSQSVPDFTLTDQDGKAFNFRSLSGKVVVVNFIYTACADVCPLLTAKFAAIQRDLKSQTREDFFLVSITTDPAKDTPEALKAYGQRFGADLHGWVFLTGSEADLKPVWRAFGVTVSAKDQGQAQHTTLTTLIDHRGVRRVNYYGDRWRDKDVIKDMIALSLRPRG